MNGIMSRSELSARLSVKEQNARFCAAMIDIHPERTPPHMLEAYRQKSYRKRVVHDVLSTAPDGFKRRPQLNSAAGWENIVAEVADRHLVRFLDIIGRSQEQRIAIARQEAMYRLRTETRMSTPAIGRKLGGRDHTTVLYGIAKHQARIDAGEAI